MSTSAPTKEKRTKKQSTRSTKVALNQPPSTVGYVLTGILGTLPCETLIDIIAECDAKTVCRLTRTCKALKRLEKTEGRTLYRKLYHNALPKASHYTDAAKWHPVYSPTQTGASTQIDLRNNLPAQNVYSWKVQFMCYVLYSRVGIFSFKCMRCYTCSDPDDFLLEESWQLRMCSLCFANVWNQAIKQVVYLANIIEFVFNASELQTDLGKSTVGKLYSAMHLAALAQEKHGANFRSRQNLIGAKKIGTQQRSDTAETAVLLLAGLEVAFLVLLDTPWERFGLCEEIEHYIQNKPLSKTSAYSNRPLSEILRDISYIVNFSGHHNNAHFLPMTEYCQGFPEQTSIDAFAQIRGLYQTDCYSRTDSEDWISIFGRTSQSVRILQEYVYNPIRENWSVVLDLWRIRRVTLKRSATLTPARIFASAFNAEQHLLELAKSKRAISTRDRTRLFALVQIAAILGIEFLSSDSLDLIQHELDMADEIDPTVGDGNFWGQDFFLHGSTEILLKKVYRVSSQERVAFFEEVIDSLALDTDSAEIGSRSLSLLTIFVNNKNMRCMELLNRNSVSRKRCEKELKGLMRSVEKGSLTVATVAVAVEKQAELVGCECEGNPFGRCKEECWLDSIDHPEWFVESNCDTDPDEEEYWENCDTDFDEEEYWERMAEMEEEQDTEDEW